MNLIEKIEADVLCEGNCKLKAGQYFIWDSKNDKGGKVEISDTENDLGCVILHNPNGIEVVFMGFKDNALKVDTESGQVKQCECVLFPATLNDTDWVLFVETKYTRSLQLAVDVGIDSPNTMISQILSTVSYFRDKNILPIDKRVHAIVAFPKLLEDFSEAFFLRSKLTREQILREFQVLLRATNEATIVSGKRIKI